VSPDLARRIRYGMGTAPIGNLYREVSDDQARETVAAAFSAGMRYFDTAPHYGFGLAERRLGAALAQCDPHGEAVVSTKVGRLLTPTGDTARERHGFVDALPFEPVFDYSAAAIRQSFDESRTRLGREADILLAHDLGAMTHGSDHERHMAVFLEDGYPALRALRDDGPVSAIGIGVNEVAVCEFLIERIQIDAILLAGRYSLLDQSAAKNLLPRCRERGIAVILGGVYNSGILARPLAEQDCKRYNYEAAPEAVLERARALEAACHAHGLPLAAAALQFAHRHPAVTGVIAGLASAEEANAMQERLDVTIPPAFWHDLAERGLVAEPAVIDAETAR